MSVGAEARRRSPARGALLERCTPRHPRTPRPSVRSACRMRRRASSWYMPTRCCTSVSAASGSPPGFLPSWLRDPELDLLLKMRPDVGGGGQRQRKRGAHAQDLGKAADAPHPREHQRPGAARVVHGDLAHETLQRDPRGTVGTRKRIEAGGRRGENVAEGFPRSEVPAVASRPLTRRDSRGCAPRIERRIHEIGHPLEEVERPRLLRGHQHDHRETRAEQGGKGELVGIPHRESLSSSFAWMPPKPPLDITRTWSPGRSTWPRLPPSGRARSRRPPARKAERAPLRVPAQVACVAVHEDGALEAPRAATASCPASRYWSAARRRPTISRAPDALPQAGMVVSNAVGWCAKSS